MNTPKYVLIKLISSETIIGTLLSNDDSTHTIDIENPYVFKTMSAMNIIGMKQDLLVFRKWFEFSDETKMSIFTNSIASIVTPNEMLIKFYSIELSRVEKDKAEEETPPENGDSSSEEINNIAGNLNLNFNFDNSDQFHVFMDNIQRSIDNMLGGMDELIGDDENVEDDMIGPPPPPPPPIRKTPNKKSKTKRKSTRPTQSFDIKFDPTIKDLSDLRGWSDNPSDYF